MTTTFAQKNLQATEPILLFDRTPAMRPTLGEVKRKSGEAIGEVKLRYGQRRMC
jgi:hypothetical protein